MEDNYNDIEKKFKDLLESVPYQEPDEQALADMQQRLDRPVEEKRRGGIVWWWVLPIACSLSLPFIIGSYYFFQQNKSAQQQIALLQTQLETDATPATAPANTEPELIVQYDTIYQTIERVRYVDRYPNNTPSTQQISARSVPECWAQAQQLEQAALAFEQPLPYSSDQAPNTTGSSTDNNWASWYSSGPAQGFAAWRAQQRLESPLLLADFAALDAIPPQSLSTEWPPKTVDLVEMPFHKDRINPLVYAVPTGVNLALTGMPALSLALPNQSALGFGASLQGELRFRSPLRLGLGIRFT